MANARYILGINAYHGDAAAVLVRDGVLVAAVEEERIRRIKHCAGFPTEAVRACLEVAGIEGAAVDYVAVGRDPAAHLGRKVWYALSTRPTPALLGDRLKHRADLNRLGRPLATAMGLTDRELPPIHRIEHHRAHLASAFLVAPFERAAVCAVDGFGDFVSTSIGVGAAGRVDIARRVYFPHSLGLLYTAITQFLGFHDYGDEFKVMGLSSYGRPTFRSEMNSLVRRTERGGFELDLRYFRHARERVEMTWDDGPPRLGPLFSPNMANLLGPPRTPDTPVTQRHADIARSLQECYADVLVHILDEAWDRTRLPALCLAGGCAMNSVANGTIRERTRFRDVYIQPAAGDNGTALGAAFELWSRISGGRRSFVMEHAFWGRAHPTEPPRPAPGNEVTIDGPFDEEGLCRRAAEMIAAGLIVGWFQGRSEWGARALGNRSILADPRRAEMRDHLNRKIKQREPFRPFAPAILEDAVEDFFVGAVPDPFMQCVFPVRPERREVIPAVTHVDGTARVQTVSPRENPRFHQLISTFAELTGVPVLLNTSFNESEPIVDTPEQAIDCFLRTRMDALVVDRFIYVREASMVSPVASESEPCPASFS